MDNINTTNYEETTFEKVGCAPRGVCQGFKKTQRIMSRMLKESAEQADLANIWANNMNERIEECLDDPMNGEVPAITIGDEYYQMNEIRVEGDIVTVITDDGDRFSFTKDTLYRRTRGFYLPVEDVL